MSNKCLFEHISTFKEHFNLCSTNRRTLEKKMWGNLSTRKRLVTLISLCISFSVFVFSDCGLASGQTYIPEVGVSCLMPAWVPSRARALGSAWGVMAHQKQSRCCCHPPCMAKPLRNMLFLPLPSSAPSTQPSFQKTLPAQKRGKQPRKMTKSLLNLRAMRTSPVKNPSEGF